MSNIKVEQVEESPLNKLGVGPHWDGVTNSLYYVDMLKGTLQRFDYETRIIYEASIDGEELVQFIIPVNGRKNEFAVGLLRRLCIVQWDGISVKAPILRTVAEFDVGAQNTFLRISKADPRGRFVGGTISIDSENRSASRHGSLYNYEKGQMKPKLLKKDIGINSLTWDVQRKKFYYIDAAGLDVSVFDYDMETGNISNGCQLIDLKSYAVEPNTIPNGMTIDADGNLYVAIYGGSSVLKINPITKEVEQKIEFPTEPITSVAFGGPNLDILFVTTANLNKADDKSAKPAPAGKLFQVTGLGCKGTVMNSIDL